MTRKITVTLKFSNYEWLYNLLMRVLQHIKKKHKVTRSDLIRCAIAYYILIKHRNIITKEEARKLRELLQNNIP